LQGISIEETDASGIKLANAVDIFTSRRECDENWYPQWCSKPYFENLDGVRDNSSPLYSRQ